MRRAWPCLLQTRSSCCFRVRPGRSEPLPHQSCPWLVLVRCRLQVASRTLSRIATQWFSSPRRSHSSQSSSPGNDRSPHQLQSKLQLPRGSSCLVDLTCRANGGAGSIEKRTVVDRWSKIRAIQCVEDLETELSIEALGNLLDDIVLHQRHIKVHQARA